MKAKKRLLILVGLGIALAGTVAVLQQAKQVKRRKMQTIRRWHPTTVNRVLSDTSPKNDLLKPLLDLGESIKMRITPALGDKGTEIAARISDEKMPPIEALQLLQKIRAALHDTQWLIETGEILQTEPSASGVQLRNTPMQLVTRDTSEEGRP